MFDVDMMRVGSEMSPLEIVFLRRTPLGRPEEDEEDGGAVDANVDDIGVLAPERGGVMFEANGETGEGRPEGVYTFGESVIGDGPLGANRSREPVWMGCRLFASKAPKYPDGCWGRLLLLAR